MNSILNTNIQPRHQLYVDLVNAKRHRNQDNYLTNPYYNEQQRILEATPFGAPLPKSIATGELPYAGRR